MASLTFLDFQFSQEFTNITYMLGLICLNRFGLCHSAESSDHMSRVVRKPAFCICENKDADQLRGNREADQRLCFRYSDSTILYFLNPKFQASSHLLWLYSPVCVRPGRKPRRPVFSQRGSYMLATRILVIVLCVVCLFVSFCTVVTFFVSK